MMQAKQTKNKEAGAPVFNILAPLQDADDASNKDGNEETSAAFLQYHEE